MNIYQLYLFVHVGAAIVWVGTSLLQAVLGARAVYAADPARMLVHAREGEWAGLHLYAPANVLVLASGLLLVHAGGFGFSQLWVDLGLGGWTLSLLIGATLLKPGWVRAAKITDPQAEADRLRGAVHRLVVLTTVDLAVLTGVVYAMTVKPTSGQPVSLAVGAAVVLLVLLLAGRLHGSGTAGGHDRRLTAGRRGEKNVERVR